jgi:hypothetical protein
MGKTPNFSLFTFQFSLFCLSLHRHSIKLLIIMKKSIYLSLVFIGLLLTATGCGNKKQANSSADDEAYRDSIAAAKAAEEAAFNKADSLAFNVWGDVKFGMTIEEVSKTGVFGTLKGSDEFYDIDGKLVSKTLGTKALRMVTLGFNNDARKLERIIFNSLRDLPASRIPDMEADIHLIASKIEAGWQTKFKYENENVTSDKVKIGSEVFHILSLNYGNASVTSNIGQMTEGKFDYDFVVSYNVSF